MLQFSPEDRITAEECINSPYFDDIREKKCEEPASHIVICPNKFIDKSEAVKFLANEIQILNNWIK